jgi:hypothetical protein
MATVHDLAALQTLEWRREHQFCHFRSWLALNLKNPAAKNVGKNVGKDYRFSFNKMIILDF